MNDNIVNVVERFTRDEYGFPVSVPGIVLTSASEEFARFKKFTTFIRFSISFPDPKDILGSEQALLMVELKGDGPTGKMSFPIAGLSPVSAARKLDLPEWKKEEL